MNTAADIITAAHKLRARIGRCPNVPATSGHRQMALAGIRDAIGLAKDGALLSAYSRLNRAAFYANAIFF